MSGLCHWSIALRNSAGCIVGYLRVAIFTLLIQKTTESYGWFNGASSGTVVAGDNGAGMGSTQLNYPRGLHFDSSANSLFIANNHAHNIVQWVLGTSAWTLVTGSRVGVSGNTSTLLSYPTHVVFDYLGSMYVSDEGNQRIQFFLAGQSSGTTIAGVTNTLGNTAQLFDTSSSVAVDSQFNIYVTKTLFIFVAVQFDGLISI